MARPASMERQHRSMRELRESLRHAALLNIVAAANTDHTQAEVPPAPVEQQRLLQHHHHHQQQQQPPMGTVPSSQHLYSSMPHHHHHYHQQQGQQRVGSPLALQVTSSRSSPFDGGIGGGGGGGAGGRSAGSSNFHPANGSSPGGATSPQTLVVNLLSPRMRTISIPRPRAHELPEPFIHRSVAQAKENLSKVGEMVRARAEGEEGGGRSGAVSALPVEITPNQYDGPWKAGLMRSGVGMMLPLRGHSLEPKHGHQQEKSGDTTAAKQTSADQSRDTSATTIASTNPHSASLASERSAATTDTSPSAGTGGRKSGGKMKEDPRQQMLSVRRHLTPSKKRELVKRLTEIAKCEAVDMTDPMANDDADLRFVSPMIIMSQQRHEIRHPEDSLPVASHTSALTNGEPSTTKPTPNGLTVTHATINGGANAGRNSLLQRTKSLTSLTGYPSVARSKNTSSGAASVGNKPLTIDHAQSVPDLLAQDGDGYITDQQDNEQPDNTDWTSESLFTNGIIGRTIRRGIEGLRNSPLESRPLVTPNARLRRGTRPTGRRSALGLRDRGPSDTPAPGFITNGEASTTRSASEAPSDPNSPPELNVPYTQVLPTLSITGLSARDKPHPGGTPANSRAARELRPSSQLSMSSSQKLFQQLDDQCEKLQRQLNITLNVPRRGSQWQHGSTPATLPMSRSDVTAHLQCVSLTDGSSPPPGRTGVKDTVTSRGRRSQNLIAHGNQPALSDVDEHSVVGGGGGGGGVGERPERASHHRWEARDEEAHVRENEVATRRQGPVKLSHFTYNDEHPPLNRKTSFSSRHSISSSVDGPSVRVNFDGVPDTDPVLQSGVKEPRYQGFSSRVGESEGRSQFHYVNTSRTDTEEEREMKFRVLKALDQDVYYDFQHRKYRSNTATPVPKCNNEEDQPRVHFYKVKVNGNS